MKFKILKYGILATILAGLVLVACNDDFLTREPQGQYSPAALKTLDGVEGLLIGAYAMLDGQGLDGQDAWNNDIQNWVFGGLTSDDAYKGTDAGDQPEQSFLERYDFQPTSVHITNKWRGLFKGVARTNDVLNTLKEVEAVSDSRRAQIVAEARFLRGIFHFEARKMWKLIPYIDDETYELNDLSSTKVPNDKEVWPMIEADFEAAMNALPETQAEVGRPTKYAAMAFLAKAYMYQGWDQSSGAANTATLQKAKAILDQIVNSGKYELTEKYEDNFRIATRNNKESIFEVQYAVSSASGDAATAGVGLAHPYIDPWGCCGFYQPSQNLVNAFKTSADGLPLLDTFNDTDVKNDQGLTYSDPFEPYTGPLDPRLDHTVGRRGILFIDFKIHGSDFIRDQSYAGPYSPKKHIAERAGFGINGWGNLSSNNYRIMRYSMILLWLAECEVELGNLERARELVNIVRARAANPAGFVPKAIQGAASRDDYSIVLDEDGQPLPAANYVIGTYDSPWANAETARKAVRFETRLEFGMEGHRFFDLVRWGIAADVLNDYLSVEGTKRTYLTGASFDKGKNEYYPVPQNAIDRSALNGSNTLQQDPAY
ncbi:RagB/SusD family nutrient uptake outer membrane protein [Marinilongibacter aquaticus]|uniref:RagB/SusD family nutrient uptake outer membrane protein n=1 Tax=Marinilongibacter aquaticus TaxID=2975157 RepID=UPI0021BD55AD|nr:RagB/SusD family nutrient uptake outer membrane protein [Marinilongibacter aquaticus]UBM57505.1 RagB/SusD family nutrient uptake outer membrane protein [Marinilongibacter aquaticus]